MEDEDRELASAFAADLPASTLAERARFEQLAMPLRGAAFNTAYWMLRNREEAEDVVQEAYLRAFRAFPMFQGDAVKPWLLQIVRNAAKSALEARQRIRRVVVLADDLNTQKWEVADDTPSPEAHLLAQDERQRLLAALATLPLIHRDVLVLREMEGLTYAQIADITEVPVGTVMSRLSRARQELRRALLRQPDG